MGTEVHKQMFQSGGQSDAKPPVFRSQESLVFNYRPTEEMKGWVNLSQPGFKLSTCGVEARYTTTQPLGFRNNND
ncbi:hypothetical protein TNCV_4595041 [Trichonephila clavipes]|uniref:Uncharacterized protein n=1 Tax=Trichonephila clavipes TaxID=2585209 RepID=A0A8X6WFV1_TRICX|nr:hypothetical protein TNCV_4595041 [Trichonephila clavipes]